MTPPNELDIICEDLRSRWIRRRARKLVVGTIAILTCAAGWAILSAGHTVGVWLKLGGH